MSGAVMDPRVKQRRLLVRAAMLLVYAGMIAVMFVFGKGHTIIIDNKDADDGSVKAIESLSVSIDGQDPLDFQAGDRDMAKVRGQGHRVEVTVKDSQMVAHKITLPLGEEVLLLSLPKLMAGQPAVVKFVPKEVVVSADDQQGNNNAFTSPDAVPAPGAPGTPAAPVPPVVP